MGTIIPTDLAGRTPEGSEISQVGDSTLRRFAPVALAFLVLAVLATYNLQYYPPTWFDEGINLLAARTLAQSGRYGLEYSGAFHAFDLSMSTGPTVIVPVALVFKVLGVSLLKGRAVMVAYLLLAALGLYSVGTQLYDRAVAIVTVLVFASATQAGPFANGRDVLGEVPALAFLFWGASVFIRARRTESSQLHLVAGLLFGLAVLTKNQLVLVWPVLVIVWLLSRSRGRGFSFWHLVLLLSLAVAPTALWLLYQLSVLGPAGFLQQLHGMSATASASSYAAPLAKALGAVRFLISSGFAVSGGTGLIYVWLLAVGEKRWSSPESILLPAFVIVWLGWYVGLSMGYARYAVPVAATSSLFVAKLFCDLGRRYTPLGRPRGSLSPRAFQDDAIGTALLAVLVLTVFSGIIQNGVTIARDRDASPQEFASLVTRDVPPGSIVESSEWEIDFLTSGTYHHPPPHLVDDAVGIVFLGLPPRALQWYSVPPSASYLIDGPFSKLAGVYQPELRQGQFEQIASVGEYDLYNRVNR